MNLYISPVVPTPNPAVISIPDPIWMKVSDIDSVEAFFIFMDAAIKCHPIVLVLSCIAGFLFVFLLFHAFRYKDKGGDKE